MMTSLKMKEEDPLFSHILFCDLCFKSYSLVANVFKSFQKIYSLFLSRKKGTVLNSS